MKFRIRRRVDGQYYLRIVARNGEPIAHSEGYTTKAAARHAANLIIGEAGGGTVVDDTI